MRLNIGGRPKARLRSKELRLKYICKSQNMKKESCSDEDTNNNSSRASNQLNYISITFGGYTHDITRVQTTILLEDFPSSTLPPLAAGPTASATREGILGLQLPQLPKKSPLEAGLFWAAVLAAGESHPSEA